MQLQANYWINLKGHKYNHPVKAVSQPSWEREVAEKPSFGWTGKTVAKELMIYDKVFSPIVIWPPVPGWQLKVPKIDLSLLDSKLESSNTTLINGFYNHIAERYKEHILTLIMSSQLLYIPSPLGSK